MKIEWGGGATKEHLRGDTVPQPEETLESKVNTPQFKKNRRNLDGGFIEASFFQKEGVEPGNSFEEHDYKRNINHLV